MKLRKCERCGEPTAEGLPLCPDCMKESGAAAEAVAAAGEAVAGIIKAIRQPRKITVHRAGDIVRVEVEGAGSRDIEAAFREAERFKILSGFKEDAE